MNSKLPPLPLEIPTENYQHLVEGISRELLAVLSDPLPRADHPHRKSIPFPSLPSHLAGETVAELSTTLRYLFDEAIPASLNTASPGYLAYIPGGGLPIAGLGDWIAATINRYVGLTDIAPLLASIEADVVHTFCRWMDLPQSAFGFLTSGGSLSNQWAITVARTIQLGFKMEGARIYTSDQAHYCIKKAAILAGFSPEQIVSIPTDLQCRLDLQQLTDRIHQDQRVGLRPFLVVATAGTTNTGAVDPIMGISQLCRNHQLWLHIDAAYGGFFKIAESNSQLPLPHDLTAGLALADSITLDPHKGLFFPYGTGALLVRNRQNLERTFSFSGEYLPPSESSQQEENFCRLSPELSRDFRGLKIWLALRLHGGATFRREIREKLDLARSLESRLQQEPRLEIFTPCQTSLVTFRLKDQPENIQLDYLERVNRRNRVHLSSTTIQGKVILRACVLSFRTHAEQIQWAIDDLISELPIK